MLFGSSGCSQICSDRLSSLATMAIPRPLPSGTTLFSRVHVGPIGVHSPCRSCSCNCCPLFVIQLINSHGLGSHHQVCGFSSWLLRSRPASWISMGSAMALVGLRINRNAAWLPIQRWRSAGLRSLCALTVYSSIGLLNRRSRPALPE